MSDMNTKPTPGHWEARRGDVLNPDREYGIVVPLSREECIEIDGDDSGYGERTEVIAEVCGGSPSAEADARHMAAAVRLREALELCYMELTTDEARRAISARYGSATWDRAVKAAREVLDEVRGTGNSVKGT